MVRPPRKKLKYATGRNTADCYYSNEMSKIPSIIPTQKKNKPDLRNLLKIIFVHPFILSIPIVVITIIYIQCSLCVECVYIQTE